MQMVVVHCVFHHRILVLHRCMVVSPVANPTYQRGLFHKTTLTLKSVAERERTLMVEDPGKALQIQNTRNMEGRVLNSLPLQSGVDDLPDHAPSDIRDIFLPEDKVILTPREGFEELTSENATVVAVCLTRGILGRPIHPTGEVERLLLLVEMFLSNIFPQMLRCCESKRPF